MVMRVGRALGVFSILTISFSLMISSARAGETDIKVAKQFGIAYLQLTVMEHDGLFEKRLASAGRNDVKVTWATLSGGGSVNDALLAGAVQFVPGGPAPFLLLWSKTQGYPKAEVKGLCGMNSIPHYLNTRKAQIRSVRDYTAQDRIALPSVGASNQAILLQMAAAQAFGIQNYKKLDSLTVSMKHPDAMVALLSGAGEITSHFTGPPFQYEELDNPAVHNVLKSYDVLGGPASFNIIYTTVQFHDQNPEIVKAFMGALEDATKAINADKRDAARIYVEVTKSKMSVEEVYKAITDPLVNFTLVPQGVMRYAEFMYQTGRLKTKPTSWKTFFFPEAYAFPGS